MPKPLDEVLALPALEWCIDELLPLRGMLVIGGTPKLGKSRLSLDLIQRAVRGRDVFGTFKPHRVERALVYNVEGGYYGVRERDRGEPPSQLFKYLAADQRRKVVIESEPIIFTDTRGILRASAMPQAVDAWGGFDLVVLDPLVHFRACDENNNQHTSVLFRAIRVAAEQAQTSVVIVHHARKPSFDNDGGAPTGNELRGASAGFGATDNVVMASAADPGLALSFDLRYAPHREPFILVADARTGLFYKRVKIGSSLVADPVDWALDCGEDIEGYAEAFGFSIGLADRIFTKAG